MSNFFILNAAYFTAASVFLWLVFILRLHRKTLWQFIKEQAWALVISLLLAAAVFSLAHVGFRIFSDETNLLSVSENIATRMRALNNIQGYYLSGGEYIAMTTELPTRPLLFPFLTACLHWILGVNPQNVFILNFILLSLLLSTAFYLLRKQKVLVRIVAVTALAFNATLSIHAATGGFDLCSLLFGCWTFMALWFYFCKPDRESLLGLVLTTLCFVQVRYESLMIIPFIVAAVWLSDKKIKERLRQEYFIWLTPLLLVPAVVQRIVTWGRFENPPGIAAFSWMNIPAHFPEVFKFFFLRWNDAYPCLLNLLGLLGLIFLIKKKKDKRAGIFFWTSFAYGSFLILLLLAHYMGIAESSTQIRLFMPLTVFLFFAMIWGFTEHRFQRVILVVCCLVQIVLGIRYLKADPQMVNLAMAQETKELRNFLGKHSFAGTLFIYRRPGQLISFGYSSVMPAFYLKNEEQIKILLQAQVIHHLYEIISRPVKSPDPLPYGPLSDWKREPRYEIPVTERFKLQIFELSLKKHPPR